MFDGKEMSYAEFIERFTPLWSWANARYHLDRGRSTEWIVARYESTRASDQETLVREVNKKATEHLGRDPYGWIGESTL